MNQSMAQIMQIQTFGCNIRCDQNTNRRFGTTKILNNTLLLGITHATGNLLNRICFQTEILAKSFRKILHSINTLSENNHTIAGISRIPSVFLATEKTKKFLITCESSRSNRFQRSLQFFEQTNILDVFCLGLWRESLAGSS